MGNRFFHSNNLSLEQRLLMVVAGPVNPLDVFVMECMLLFLHQLPAFKTRMLPLRKQIPADWATFSRGRGCWA